jgi:predicted transposase/invertase (TIGR01784 family)
MPISKFLDPKNDVAFKKIFGTEKNKDILIHFLNDMLIFKEKKPIQEVVFLKTIQDPDIAAKKTSIVDILCKDGDGNTYIVEMQVAKTKGFEKRAQYYASKAYSGQINQGGEYANLKEVIFLAIADFVMFPGKVNYKSDHIILDKDTYEHDLKDFSFTFLELEKFTKRKEELSTLVEKWVYFFKHADETTESDLKDIIGQDFIIQKAYEELNRFYWNEDELSDYEAVIKKESDYIASMEQKYDEGFLKGKNQGFSDGKSEGFLEGQRKKKLLLATRMLETGSDEDFVAKITGLPAEDVADLKKNLAS